MNNQKTVKKSKQRQEEPKWTNKQWLVNRLFIGGLMDGMEYQDKTSVWYPVGWTCEKPIGSSPYKILSCEEV